MIPIISMQIPLHNTVLKDINIIVIIMRQWKICNNNLGVERRRISLSVTHSILSLYTTQEHETREIMLEEKFPRFRCLNENYRITELPRTRHDYSASKQPVNSMLIA